MNKYLQFSKYTTGCPQWLIDKAKIVDRKEINQVFVTGILKSIKEEFDPQIHTISKTNNFNTSRFISVNEILEKRQYSCGSLTTVVASVLRNLGLPTKLIDGKFVKRNPNMRHAWVEVWLAGNWVPFDIMQKDFKLTDYHIRKGEYSDWSELEN